MKKIALVGMPNTGKSSLFNLLTGLNQKIANYPGATVDKKMGLFEDTQIVDLPGLKNLCATTLDEQISQQEILNFTAQAAPILFVANAMHLENSLLLYTQIADLQTPMAMVINFKDDLTKNNITINLPQLKERLGCEVILMNSQNGDGLADVKALITQQGFVFPNSFCRSTYEVENETSGVFENTYRQTLQQVNSNYFEGGYEQFETDFINRQKVISQLLNDAVIYPAEKDAFLNTTQKIDRFALHPIAGLFFFLAIMFLVFQAVFTAASYPMEWIDAAFAALGAFLANNISPAWLASLLSDGIVPGVGGVLIFIPQIAILFFFLGVLEHTGYLARVSYISDNFLQKFGLSGSSIIPLMSGLACAIPAIMSARTIEQERERMAVILATPLMTCSARLPVYAILVALIFPNESVGWINIQGLAFFSLYLLGTIATLAVAWLLSKFIKSNQAPFWTLELPVYRFPNWRNIGFNVYNKTKSFVLEAGKIIFLISILLWLLASFSPHSSAYIQDKYQAKYAAATTTVDVESGAYKSLELEYSYAGYLGKTIEPFIKPLGYDWKIGIALITSFAAREVFVGTLSTIYSIGSEEETTIIGRLQNETNADTGGKRFDVATSVSLLLFYVFALQCMSTLAIVKKETDSWKYPVLQFIFMFVLAYVAALLAYVFLG